MPFFLDLDGKSVIDLALDAENNTMLELILENFMDYSIDHHDRLIADSLPDIILSEIEVVGPYLDARVKTLGYLK